VEDAASNGEALVYLDFEDLSGWRNVSLEDGGWDGVCWAFRDVDRKSKGKSSARVQFTMNSINKETGQINERKGRIVWRYVGPPVQSPSGRRVGFSVMPHRATDVKGNLTVASKYISFRVIDAAGNTLVDERIDPEGTLSPLKWHRVHFELRSPHDEAIKSIEFYVDMAIEELPWDQRLTLWVDGIRFVGRH
jgi:hypothetical protein